jgi:hypothetical protein
MSETNANDANEQASTSSGAAAAPSSSTALAAPATAEQQGNIMARLFDRMNLERQQRKEAKQKYAFWETQPVMQFAEGSSNNVGACAAGCQLR